MSSSPPSNKNEDTTTTSSIITCDDFWNTSLSIIKQTERHAFLVSMVDGTLQSENFKYYVKQDALYLHDFADCLFRLSKTAPNAQYSKRLEEFAIGARESELSLHLSFFKEWNIVDESDANDVMLKEQMPNCLLYTSYMKRVVMTESHEHGLAVLLPCFWVYMHVGKCMLQLRQELGNSVARPPQYDAWIDMYGGEDFEREVKDYISMVNDALNKLQQQRGEGTMTGEDNSSNPELIIKEMEHHFIMSCKLEHMFWDQAVTMMEWPKFG